MIDCDCNKTYRYSPKFSRGINRKKTGLFLIVFIAIFCLTDNLPLYSAEPVIVKPDISRLSLVPYLEVLKDKNNRLTFSDIVSPEFSDSFIKSKQRYPVFTFSSASYWIRFEVKNPLTGYFEWYFEIANPMINSIELYILDHSGKLIEKRIAGDRYPYDQREIKNRNFVFKLREPPVKKRVYYVRIKTEALINLSFSMHSAICFLNTINRETIALGIYFGAILVMIIFNLFIFISFREASYLYYVIYYSVYYLFHMSLSGLGYQYLWPDSVWWQTHNLPIFMLLSVITSIQFLRSYLEIPLKLPEIDNLFKIVMIISAIMLPFTVFVDYSFAVKFGISDMFITAVLITYSLVRYIPLGYRPARFYLLSWIFLVTGTIIYALKSFAIIPDNFYTLLLFQVSSILELIIITLGLADRINYMKVQSEARRMNLEIIVNERTNELNLALSRMEKRDKEIQKELCLAANIQEGILPQTPFSIRGVKIDAYYKAMGKVSGDFYDIFQMSGGYLGILIADVSGHGMPAAFITAMAKINFSEAIQNNLFPTEIFKTVNTELVEIIKTDDFLTAFLIIISPSYEVFYSNASHQMPMILRKSELIVERWDTNGLFIGALDVANDMFEDARDNLDYGDRILLFTDGIVESKNKANESFGEKRLRRLLIETAGLPVESAKKRIVSEWEEFTMGKELIDDTTLLIVEIDPAYKNLVNYREEGFRFLVEGKIEDAIEVLKKALKIDMKDEKTHLYIGECYLKSRNYLKAIEHLKEYLANNEIDANVWFHLAQAYFNLGDYMMANETALKAAQLRNDSADVLIISGLSLRDMGQHKEAAKIWERLLAIEPNNELALSELKKYRKDNEND